MILVLGIEHQRAPASTKTHNRRSEAQSLVLSPEKSSTKGVAGTGAGSLSPKGASAAPSTGHHKKPRPKWLADKIAANTRQAHPATCTGCGTPVLAGPDGNMAAIQVMVDPDPATPLQQLRHLINGHRTYTLAARELDLIDHHGPACTLPVHLEHICQEATP